MLYNLFVPASPEFSINQHKEIILSQSPLLRTFLNYKKLADFDGWVGELAELTFNIEGEIDDNLGLGFTDLSTDLLLIAAKHHHVFRGDSDNTILSQVAKTLFLIGHEVKDFDVANLFLTDIMVQLQRIRLLHPLISSDPWIKEKTIGVVRSFLDSGVYVKEYYFSDPSDESEKTSGECIAVPGFIKDFINQIPELPDNPVS